MSDDLTLTEQFIDDHASTPEQAEAVKRTLGVERQAQQASLAWAPQRPPRVLEGAFDELAHARATVDRYSSWVDSWPDEDPAPLRNRRRALRLAIQAVKRLEGA